MIETAANGECLQTPAKLLNSAKPLTALVARTTMVSVLAIGPGYLITHDWFIALLSAIVSLPSILGFAMMFTGWQAKRTIARQSGLDSEYGKNEWSKASKRITFGFVFVCIGLFFGILALI